MRKLATIQRIKALDAIPNADKIEVATILGWKVVVAKDVGHKVGDLVVYCEVDSFLPIRPEFEFLRKSSHKIMDGKEGFRLKTVRLRGQISQGLVLPLSILNKEDEMVIGESEQPGGKQLQIGPYDDAIILEEGADVTEWLGISKYEPPIPANLSGVMKGGFPSFIPKTDETRVQVLQELLTKYKGILCYIAEKIDGSSVTYYVKDGQFGVCSRNMELVEDGENTYWKIANELQLKEKLLAYGKNIALQGEIYGEGIQGNPCGIKGQKVAFFNVFDIDRHCYYDYEDFWGALIQLGNLPCVPMLFNTYHYHLHDNIDEWIQFATRKQYWNPDKWAEGIVIRPLKEINDPQFGRVSFKAINPEYLLSENE